MSRASAAPPADLIHRLAAAAAVIGVSLDGAQQMKLVRYVVLLDRWGKTFNLSAIHGQGEALTQHVLDSLSILPSVERWAGGRPIHVLDAGSGAGLPGVVLAIAKPDWQVTTLDAVGKKVAFVRQVAGELGIANLKPVHGRVERARPGSGFDLVVSRAFASLSEFVASTQNLLVPGGAWAAMKGRRPDAEIAGLPDRVAVFHVEPLVVPGLNAARCLVWIRPN